MSDSLKDAIEFSLSETAPCSYKAEFKIAKDAVDVAFSKALKNAIKHAELPGFRKGKAPEALVRARYMSYVVEDVEREFQSKAFEKMTENPENDIVSVGSVTAQTKPALNSDYLFSIELELAPKFNLPEYKGISLTLEKGDDVEESMAKRLDYMKNLYSDYVTIEEPAVKGDMLKVSYESDFETDGETLPSLARAVKCDEAWFWLNEPEQMPGLIIALTGAVKGGEYSFPVTFPDDWREEALRGKTVNYKVKVHEAQRKVPISDEAELAKKIGLESVDKMKTELRAAAEQEVAYAKEEQAKGKALEFLLAETVDFALPKGILASTTEREFSRIAERLVRSEKDVEEFKANKEKHLEDAKKEAEAFLRKFFILRKIARDEDITVSQDEINNQITAMSSYMGYKEADVRKMLERNGGTAEVHADLMMSKVLAKIASEAKTA